VINDFIELLHFLLESWDLVCYFSFHLFLSLVSRLMSQVDSLIQIVNDRVNLIDKLLVLLFFALNVESEAYLVNLNI
jgi:hypothetical protein